jgi:hypothetical protein
MYQDHQGTDVYVVAVLGVVFRAIEVGFRDGGVTSHDAVCRGFRSGCKDGRAAVAERMVHAHFIYLFISHLRLQP